MLTKVVLEFNTTDDRDCAYLCLTSHGWEDHVVALPGMELAIHFDDDDDITAILATALATTLPQETA